MKNVKMKQVRNWWNNRNETTRLFLPFGIMIVFLVSFIGVMMYGMWRGSIVTAENGVKNGSHLIENLQAHGFTILNATVDSPIVTVELDNLELLMAKAEQLNMTIIYKTTKSNVAHGFMVLDNNIGYSYTFTEPYIGWTFP